MENARKIHSYRLVFTEAGSSAILEVEFDETRSDPAFNIARRACGRGEVRIFADDRLLGRIRGSPGGSVVAF
jgi:hypothetical protein